jgi:hypothetical protein
MEMPLNAIECGQTLFSDEFRRAANQKNKNKGKSFCNVVISLKSHK